MWLETPGVNVLSQVRGTKTARSFSLSNLMRLVFVMVTNDNKRISNVLFLKRMKN
jgi:hypothetical protein